MKRIMQEKGLNGPDADRAFWEFRLPKIGRPSHCEELRRFIDNHGLDVVILDPTYLMMDGDGVDNLFKMGAQLSGVTEIIADTGATPIIIHHTKRHTGRDPYDEPELEDIAWAGIPGILQAVDSDQSASTLRPGPTRAPRTVDGLRRVSRSFHCLGFEHR